MRYAMILLNNNRSKSYLQNLIREGYPPSEAIVLGEEPNCISCGKEILSSYGIDTYFDASKSIYETLRESEIPHRILPTLNANDESVISAVSRLNSAYLIYSGPGGIILKKDILSQGVSFYHAHPGIVPQYKGSTTFYYSMILRKKIGCSILKMSEKLDGGDVMFCREYNTPPMPTDYDQTVDPLIRTETFVLWLKSIDWCFENAVSEKQTANGNMFYIIHPVLKHLAVLSMETTQKEV